MLESPSNWHKKAINRTLRDATRRLWLRWQQGAIERMRYQLVLQFRGDSLTDYDQMVSLESQLIEALGDSADVDCHDMGSGERNIFILTSNPHGTFQKAKPLLKGIGLLQELSAAFREVNGTQYTVIWPEGSRLKFTVA